MGVIDLCTVRCIIPASLVYFARNWGVIALEMLSGILAQTEPTSKGCNGGKRSARSVGRKRTCLLSLSPRSTALAPNGRAPALRLSLAPRPPKAPSGPPSEPAFSAPPASRNALPAPAPKSAKKPPPSLRVSVLPRTPCTSVLHRDCCRPLLRVHALARLCPIFTLCPLPSLLTESRDI